jgi:hypothetical protein
MRVFCQSTEHVLEVLYQKLIAGVNEPQVEKHWFRAPVAAAT